MEVNLEKLSPVLVELQVVVPADAVKKEIDSAYDKLRRTARVRGFRKGKAPRRVLNHLYGPAINADVAKRLVDRSLKLALSEKEIQPLTQPDLEPTELQPSEDFSFKARFEVRPEIEKVNWKELKAQRPPTKVADDQVDEEIEKLRKVHSTVQPLEQERPAQKGDVVTIDLAYEIGEKSGTEELEAEVGGAELVGDIDEALVGMTPGDVKKVEPESKGGPKGPDGKELSAKFEITLKEVKERVLPDVDDEFAKDCGEYDDLAALKQAQRDKLEKQLHDGSQEQVARQLVDALCEANEVPVPPSLVEQQTELAEREFAQMARAQGREMPLTPEMRERLRVDAEKKVRAGLLMAEIAKRESVKVGDEDIEKGCAQLAEQSGKNVAKVRAEYRDRAKREQLIGMILEDKILDLLESSANITEADDQTTK